MMQTKNSRGFTIVELVVVIAVGSIMSIAAVGTYVVMLQQASSARVRNTLALDLESALGRINDDVRQSANVSLYNRVADTNAPTTKAGYENVPGPDDDTDSKYFWRMGPNRLLMNQTPVTTAGVPIYDDMLTASGSRNTIIYYVRDGALYRRVVAAAYANNSVSTLSCAAVATGGCVNSDIKILGNLKKSLGDAAFQVTYYDQNGNVIDYTRLDGSGVEIPDYSRFPLTRSVGVRIELESDNLEGGRKISLNNSMRMQFRSGRVTSSSTPSTPETPTPGGVTNLSMTVGPGGLAPSGMYGEMIGGTIYVMGKVSITGMYYDIKGGSGKVLNLYASNKACGSGASYPSLCTDQPISVSGMYSGIYGTVCARGQTSSSGISKGGGQGLVAGCVPPDTPMPNFNKSEFVAGMTAGTAASSTASCSGSNKTVAAKYTYTGNVSVSNCTLSLAGSVYITGNLSGSSGKITVAESAGAVRPIVVVNGSISLGLTVQANSYGTTPYFISFMSSDTACSNSSSCTTLTPEMLKSSIDNVTAVTLNDISASGSTFYAYFGGIRINGSANVGALAGQKVSTGSTMYTEIVMDGEL